MNSADLSALCSYGVVKQNRAAIEVVAGSHIIRLDLLIKSLQ